MSTRAEDIHKSGVGQSACGGNLPQSSNRSVVIIARLPHRRRGFNPAPSDPTNLKQVSAVASLFSSHT